MKREHKSRGQTLTDLLPPLEFQNPFSEPAHSARATTFLPQGFEKGYAYPLLIWLSGSNDSRLQLSHIMPGISMRNYIGVAPTANRSYGPSNQENGTPFQQDEMHELVFQALDRAQLQYNINPERIFVGGCGCGGTQALRLAMTHSEYFAGAISLCGSFPETRSILHDIRVTRHVPIFLAQSRDDNLFDENWFCDNLRTLHVAGFSVTARQYPGAQIVSEQMLHDTNTWMMEIVNGYDMTTTG